MKKKRIIGRRIASILLTLTMILGEFAEGGLSVFAADDEDAYVSEEAVSEDVTEDEVTEAEDAVLESADDTAFDSAEDADDPFGSVEDRLEDVIVDESEDQHAAATWVKVVTNGSYIQLNADGTGYSSDSASLSNGVLKLKNYTAADNYGGYTKLSSMGGNEEEYYGIYADGDLTIELEGTNSFDLGLNKEDITRQFGIYIKGSLTIRNVKGKNGSLSIDLNGKSGSNKADYTYGIYTLSNLTIGEQDGGSLTLNISGSRAEINSFGIKVDGYTTQVNGGTVTVNTVAGKTRSYGLSLYEYIQSAGSMTVKPASSSGSSTNESVALHASADLLFTKGSMAIKPDNITGSGKSIAVVGDYDVTIASDAVFEGGSTSGGRSVGVWVAKKGALNLWAKTTLKGNEYAVLAPSIDTDGSVIVEPSPYSFKAISENGYTYYYVCDSSNTAAKEVQTDLSDGYMVWVGGTQINDQNKSAIPGVTGTASYDPSSKTLYLKNVSGISGTYSRTADEYALIYSKEDLNIELESDSVISMPMDAAAKAQYGICVKGNLNIRNASGKNGSLKVDLYCDGQGSGSVQNSYAVYCSGSLSVDERNGKLELDISDNISTYIAYGIQSEKMVTVNGGKISITTLPASTAKGIFSEYYDQNGGEVLIEAYQKSVLKKNANNMCSLDASYIDISAGKLTAHAAKGGAASIGINCKKTFSLGQEGEIDAVGGEANKNATSSGIFGEFDCDGNNKIVIGGQLRASGKQYAVATKLMSAGDGVLDVKSAISLANGAKLIKPSGGIIDAGGTDAKRRFIGDSSGTAATDVLAGFKNMYEVSFDLNGMSGTEPVSQYVEEGATASEPSAPLVTGYIFAGWYTEAACTNKFSFSTPITKDTILYAKWNENKVYYTVTFDANGHGTAPSAQTVESGKTATQPAAPTATGYTFGGWYKEASCKNAYKFTTAVTANITLYAKWTINQYTVTFKANGHGSAPSSVKVSYGGTVTKPTDPTATGYTFGGWYLESACTNAYDFSAAVTDNIILYAKWTINQYTVTFDANGHGTAPSPVKVDYGSKVTKPTDPTATGYTFGGWYKEASCTNAYSFNTAVKADITLYAKWTENAKVYYTVTFNANGHGTAPSAQQVESGKTATQPTAPTATGYTFGGWYKESSCTNAYNFSTAVTANITLYAKWTINQCTVTFNANGHGTAPSAVKVNYGSTVSKPTDPTASGYTFGGWYKESSCTNAYNFSSAVTANITLYAKWTENAKVYYTVTFNANGHGTAPSAQQVESGKTATQPTAPTATGYTFGGWYKESSCKNAYSFSTAVTANITLYAKWTINQYTVTFNANGHGTAPSAVKVNYGSTVTKPTDPTATGYTFGGWYKESSCTNAYNFSSAVTANITLYAKWTENAKVYYTVTFNVNGHGTAPSAQQVESGKTATQPTAPTATGYTFGGWYKESSCTNAYNFSTAVTANITLYAKWTINQYTVTFNANGHGTAPSAVKVNYGSTVTKPTDPTATGYTFGGWYKESSCQNAYNFSTAVTANITLYAKWTINQYTVTFDANGHGTAPSAVKVNYGSTVTKPSDPTATGYTFGGWYKESSCTNAYNFSTAVTANITLYAKWTQIQVVVTFNANGHGTAPSQQKLSYGAKAVKPTDPSETGYTFGGWYKESGCKNAYDFSTAVTSNITLYAKWTINQYTVTFNANGHGTAPSAEKVNYGSKVTKPTDPSASGYEFGGWFTDSSCSKEYDFDTLVDKSFTLYAKWTEIYTVSFNANGHGTQPQAQKIVKGEKAKEPAALEAEGFIFGGWYKEKDCKNRFDFSTAITANITLYAKWTEKEPDKVYYSVSFNMNGKKVDPPATLTVEKGQKAVKPADPELEGYEFGGWYKESSCKNKYDFDTAVTADITLYAKWTEVECIVTFYVSGQNTAPSAVKVKYGNKVAKPEDPEVEGYIFGGWHKDIECKIPFDFNTLIKEDISLYAKWTEQEFTFTFNANGHGVAPDAQKVKYGQKAVRPEAPTADGYIFDDWYVEDSCKTKYSFDTPVKKDTTVYAQWIKEEEPEPEYFTVSFDLNGHGQEIPKQVVEKGKQIIKPSDPGESGFIFGGWYKEKSCKNAYDFDTPVTKDITLYARWTEEAHDLEGGLSALDPVPDMDDSTGDLYLVKGQKFEIGKGWKVNDKVSKKYVSVSKKGVLKAKKDTPEDVSVSIWYEDREVMVHISKPSVPKSLSLTIEDPFSKPSERIGLDNPAGLKVYWYSASPDVATVDANGNVKAEGKGKAKITAYINGSAYNCTVSVKEKVAAKTRTLHLNTGASKSLSLTGVKKPVWTSANDAVATIKKNKVTAVGAGSTTLTAVAGDEVYTVSLIVENIGIKGINAVLTPQKGKNKYKLVLGEGQNIDVVFESVKQAVVFKSSKPDIAFLDENGHVYARKAGKGKFTAKINGKTVTIDVIIN